MLKYYTFSFELELEFELARAKIRTRVTGMSVTTANPATVSSESCLSWLPFENFWKLRWNDKDFPIDAKLKFALIATVARRNLHSKNDASRR